MIKKVGILLAASPVFLQAQQAKPITLPAGTQLPVSIPQHLGMRVGEPIHAELLYPVYAENQLVLPAKTIVNGEVTALTPDHSRRVQARLRADFTPFRTPVVRFDSVVLPGGAVLPIVTTTATDGAPVYRLVKPPQRQGGFVKQQFQNLQQFTRDRIAVVTSPGKGDRALQLLYSQLPYHPQRIAKDTAWTVETAAPANFASAVLPPPPAPAAAEPDRKPTWLVQAYLADPMSSATAHSGQAIRAMVAEPVLNADGSVAVPQGSILTGTITKARPARKLARAGELRFSFRELTLPGGQPQVVRAAVQGVDSASSADLAMDSEGNVQPKPKDKVIVPLLLLALAATPLHHENENGIGHQLRRNAGASNAVGVIGFIVGTAAQQPNVAAGIGFYGAALAIYNRVFSRGKEVAFPRDTRVVIQTSPTRSTPLTAQTAQMQ